MSYKLTPQMLLRSMAETDTEDKRTLAEVLALILNEDRLNALELIKVDGTQLNWEYLKPPGLKPGNHPRWKLPVQIKRDSGGKPTAVKLVDKEPKLKPSTDEALSSLNELLLRTYGIHPDNLQVSGDIPDFANSFYYDTESPDDSFTKLFYEDEVVPDNHVTQNSFDLNELSQQPEDNMSYSDKIKVSLARALSVNNNDLKEPTQQEDSQMSNDEFITRLAKAIRSRINEITNREDTNEVWSAKEEMQAEKLAKELNTTVDVIKATFGRGYTVKKWRKSCKDWDSGKLGTDERYVKVSKADDKLMDLLDGKTEDNPRGTQKVINIRLPYSTLDPLSEKAKAEGMGDLAYIRAVLEDHVSENPEMLEVDTPLLNRLNEFAKKNHWVASGVIIRAVTEFLDRQESGEVMGAHEVTNSETDLAEQVKSMHAKLDKVIMGNEASIACTHEVIRLLREIREQSSDKCAESTRPKSNNDKSECEQRNRGCHPRPTSSYDPFK